MTLAALPINSDGKPGAYAWPGGYHLFYLTEQNQVLCPRCAGRSADWPDDLPMVCDANWEDPSLNCDQCGRRIESACADD